MRVVLLANPISGRGRATALSRVCAASLRQRRHRVSTLYIDAHQPKNEAPDAIDQADIAVILGGDGTLHHLIDPLLGSQKPVYHVPLGTENLFARHFAMTRHPQDLADAIEHNRTTTVDVATCNQRSFALMASIGPDANIIQRVAARRRGRISHLTYLRPILTELRAPGFTPLTITADDQTLVRETPGIALVANAPQYALRLNPAHLARLDDGQLDLIFLPCSSRVRALKWTTAARLRRLSKHPGAIHTTARHIRIEPHTDNPTFYQLDGEARGTGVPSDPHLTRTQPIDCRVRPAALRVLLPATTSPRRAATR